MSAPRCIAIGIETVSHHVAKLTRRDIISSSGGHQGLRPVPKMTRWSEYKSCIFSPGFKFAFLMTSLKIAFNSREQPVFI